MEFDPIELCVCVCVCVCVKQKSKATKTKIDWMSSVQVCIPSLLARNTKTVWTGQKTKSNDFNSLQLKMTKGSESKKKNLVNSYGAKATDFIQMIAIGNSTYAALHTHTQGIRRKIGWTSKTTTKKKSKFHASPNTYMHTNIQWIKCG